MKTCTRCRECKPLSDYGRDRQQKDGHKNYCIPCDRIMQREANQARKEGRGKRLRAKAVPEHECVFVQYGDKEPVCFKCYFHQQRMGREGRVMA